MKNQEQNIEQLVESLPDELAPKRDLWQGIEQAVAKTSQDVPKRPLEVQWGAVAAVVAPIALVAGILMNNQQTMEASPAWLEPVSASYEFQKQAMLRQVDGKAVVNSNWQQTLKELEDAEASLKEALKHQPQDPALMKMLNQVYQQQLDVISKSHQSKFMQI